MEDRELFNVVLTGEEITKTLNDIDQMLKRILYIYEKSEVDNTYDYKSYVYSVILYLQSFNSLVNFELTSIIIELNSIIVNDLNKKQIRKIVLDNRSNIKSLIHKH